MNKYTVSQKMRKLWQAVVSTSIDQFGSFSVKGISRLSKMICVYSIFLIPLRLLTYLLLNSCDGNDVGGSEKSWLCNVLALKRAGLV